MEKTLEQLKFELSEKEDALSKLAVDVFIYNPEISELVSEINALRTEIKALEEENC